MPIQPNKTILALFLAMSLSGCTTLDRPHNDATSTNKINKTAGAPIEQPEEAKRLDIDWVLSYYRHFSTMPSRALNEEYQQTKKALSANKTEKNQWRMALLLSVPGTAFHDAERSSSLFKELSNEGMKAHSALSNTALMMHSLLSEQSRMSKKSEELAAQLVEAESANKTMQQQLNALKAIENSLYERNKTEAPSKP